MWSLESNPSLELGTAPKQEYHVPRARTLTFFQAATSNMTHPPRHSRRQQRRADEQHALGPELREMLISPIDDVPPETYRRSSQPACTAPPAPPSSSAAEALRTLASNDQFAGCVHDDQYTGAVYNATSVNGAWPHANWRGGGGDSARWAPPTISAAPTTTISAAPAPPPPPPPPRRTHPRRAAAAAPQLATSEIIVELLQQILILLQQLVAKAHESGGSKTSCLPTAHEHASAGAMTQN